MLSGITTNEYVRAQFHIYILVETSWRPASACALPPVLAVYLLPPPPVHMTRDQCSLQQANMAPILGTQLQHVLIAMVKLNTLSEQSCSIWEPFH